MQFVLVTSQSWSKDDPAWVALHNRDMQVGYASDPTGHNIIGGFDNGRDDGKLTRPDEIGEGHDIFLPTLETAITVIRWRLSKTPDGKVRRFAYRIIR